jgi:hypothetical protein
MGSSWPPCRPGGRHDESERVVARPLEDPPRYCAALTDAVSDPYSLVRGARHLKSGQLTDPPGDGLEPVSVPD